MRRRRPRGVGVVLALVLGVSACAGAPAVPTGDADGITLARFADARALAATPAGVLYVVDASESAVYRIGVGEGPAVFGGAGTGAAALLDPVDVDPTNGQAVFVADAAGTVTHFTVEGRAAETVAVPEVDPARAARAMGPVPSDAPRGRPVAVAAGTDGSLYVVEAERGVVLRLNEQRSVERVLGGSGAGALAEPVDLALGQAGTVFVADRARRVVQTFDAFGAPGPVLPVDGAPVAVSVAGDSLLVVTAATVSIHTLDGRRVRVVPVAIGEPLRDAVLRPRGLVVLTRTRLIALDGR